MATQISTEPDKTDLDTFFMQYPNRYGIFIHEDNPNTARPTPSNIKPTSYISKDYLENTNKATHFFPAPSTNQTITCLCNQYHTKFISNENTIYQPNQILSIAKSHSQIKKLLKRTEESSEFTSPLITSQSSNTHTHPCYKCQQEISCEIRDNQRHYLHKDGIFESNNIYHKLYLQN